MLDNLHTDSSFFRVHHMVHRVYHPKVLDYDCLLVYGIYLIYGILNPKKKYYLASYWLPGEREDGYSSNAMSLKSGKWKRV